MDGNKDFELPSASEKLSYKFIMDAMKDRKPPEEVTPKEEEMVPPPPVPEEENCGRETEVPALVETTAEVVGTEIEFSPQTDLPALPPLPENKKYFRIGEVSELIGVEPYVLRYWEGEFSALVRPIKSKTGQRVYARKDVETLAQIRHLLHVEKFSIKGAKKRLLEGRKQNQPKSNPAIQKHELSLKRLLGELKELVALAKADPGM